MSDCILSIAIGFLKSEMDIRRKISSLSRVYQVYDVTMGPRQGKYLPRDRAPDLGHRIIILPSDSVPTVPN